MRGRTKAARAGLAAPTRITARPARLRNLKRDRGDFSEPEEDEGRGKELVPGYDAAADRSG